MRSPSDGALLLSKPFRMGMLLLLPILASCRGIMKVVIGMNDFKHRASIEDQIRSSHKYNVFENGLILDTEYRKRWDSTAFGRYDLHKSLIQPLQVRIYDKDGYLLRIVVNCNVGGLPNLKWKTTGVFDSIPLRRDRIIDSTITIAGDSRYMRYLQDGRDAVFPAAGKPTILVLWTHVMGRQSKRLIRYAKEAQEKRPDEYSLFFVVSDDLYLDF